MQKMLGALAAAAVLVAGCTSGGGASESSSPTVTPGSTSAPQSASSSPVPTRTGPLTTGPGVRPGEKPPVLDPEGLKHTPSGALAAAAFYMRALDWAHATTDATLLRRISSEGCQACRREIDGIERLNAQGGYLKGARIAIESGSIVDGKGAIPADHIIKVVAVQGPTVVLMPSQAPRTDQAKPETFTSYIYVTWSRGEWRVDGVYGP